MQVQERQVTGLSDLCLDRHHTDAQQSEEGPAAGCDMANGMRPSSNALQGRLQRRRRPGHAQTIVEPLYVPCRL